MLTTDQTQYMQEPLAILYPSRVSSVQDTVLGYPALSEEALGWLAYLNRKIGLQGSWAKSGRPHEAWDNRSGAPVQSLYRYDLTYGSMALGLMADIKPAWREGYAKILGFLSDRMLEYWAFAD
jgi:hypothetical protein